MHCHACAGPFTSVCVQGVSGCCQRTQTEQSDAGRMWFPYNQLILTFPLNPSTLNRASTAACVVLNHAHKTLHFLTIKEVLCLFFWGVFLQQNYVQARNMLFIESIENNLFLMNQEQMKVSLWCANIYPI